MFFVYLHIESLGQVEKASQDINIGHHVVYGLVDIELKVRDDLCNVDLDPHLLELLQNQVKEHLVA